MSPSSSLPTCSRATWRLLEIVKVPKKSWLWMVALRQRPSLARLGFTYYMYQIPENVLVLDVLLVQLVGSSLLDERPIQEVYGKSADEIWETSKPGQRTETEI